MKELPKDIINMICNDYLQHNHIVLMYNSALILLMQTINRYYHIYTKRGDEICGKKGYIVYNTDRIGLHDAILVNDYFFLHFSRILEETIKHIKQVNNVRVGDKILFSNGRKKFAHIVTRVSNDHYHTNYYRISKYSLTRRVFDCNMIVTKEFLHGMNYIYVHR
jgi:hypothetical protein